MERPGIAKLAGRTADLTLTRNLITQDFKSAKIIPWLRDLLTEQVSTVFIAQMKSDIRRIKVRILAGQK